MQSNKTMINISFYSVIKCTRKILRVNDDTAALTFIRGKLFLSRGYQLSL